MNATDLFQRLWMASLAVTLGVAVVTVLRRPWRHMFGAEQVCMLWGLPVLAVLASQLPHLASVSPPPVWLRVHWDNAVAAPAAEAADLHDPRAWWLSVWLAGLALMLIGEVWRQYRFMRRVQRDGSQAQPHEGLPVVGMTGAGDGPALFGCWRPRILVPVDFERRYDADERALILAHEHMHARRGDLAFLLLGVCLRAVFWFNPVIWWALRCLRRDQEMACDAAMLRQRRVAPRRYADVLLKTQLSSAMPVPIGCTWHTHPVKERIIMLKRTYPNSFRRSSGLLLAVALSAALVTAVYAQTGTPGPSETAASASASGAERDGSTVSTHMRDKSVRDAARTIAGVAGLTLDNPQALSTREVSFNFKGMEPTKALHILAEVDGKRAVFNGKHVRFEAQ